MGDVVTLRKPEQVWICAGIDKPWRVASESRTFGEFHEIANAQKFLWLLLLGNDDLEPLVREEG